MAPPKKLEKGAAAGVVLSAVVVKSSIPVAPFVVAAVVLHGGGFFGASLIPHRTYESISYSQRTMSLEIEIDDNYQPSRTPDRPRIITDRAPQDPDPTRASDPERSSTEPQTAENRQARSTRRGNSGHSTGNPDASGQPGDGTGQPGDGVMTGEGPGDTWSAPGDYGDPLPGTPGAPRIGLGDLGVGTAAPPAPTEAPKTAKVSRDKANEVIGAAVRDRDKEFGLDFPGAGTIASIFKSTVQGSEAPGNSKATFQVTLGPGGAVQSVKVVSSVGGSAGIWSGVAKAAQGSIASIKFNMPSGFEKGAVVVVNVQSKVKMPSGSEVDAGLKLSLEQTFDVADIGARPTKVITASASASPVK